MTVADAIAQFLADKGVIHAFGIIGAGNAALFEAIARLEKTQIVCCHHEAAAVMAATYWGRARESVGCAIVTTGAGSSNAITGALAANMDSAPVLIISGNEPSRYMGAVTRIVGVQGYHTSRVAQMVSKCSWKMVHPEQARGGLQFSWDEALGVHDRPGPVWIDIPRDFFNANI